jgi:folate-binding protein YgfZ
VIYRVPDPGYLRIGGADRAVYIQRQTTNDVGLLAPDRSLLTVLTSGTARILDVWRLVMEPGSDEIGVITLPGRGAATARYLQSRIFFKDQVTVTDASADFTQFEVFGPAAETVLGDLPAPDSLIAVQIDGAAVRVFGLRDDAYGLMTEVGQGENLAARLIEAGAVLLNAEAYEVLRVRSGRPGPLRTHREHTPLEANLDGAISSTKGCYSGQEVIGGSLPMIRPRGGWPGCGSNSRWR